MQATEHYGLMKGDTIFLAIANKKPISLSSAGVDESARAFINFQF